MDPSTKLEERVDTLARTLARVERRLEEIEARLEMSPEEVVEAAPEVAPAVAPAAAEAAPVPEEADFVTVITLLGRSLLGLAGAYLLRALTSGGPETLGVGVVLGLVYAALWVVLADRAGGRGRTASAGFYGATAVLIVLPLLWETTARFKLLSPEVSAAALTGFVALALAVAWRRSLAFLAWAVSLGAGVLALLLGGSTHAPVPFTVFLVLLGVVTFHLGRSRGFVGLAWATAFSADLAVLLLETEGRIGGDRLASGEAVVLQMALFFLYAASFVRDAWRPAGRVSVFAVAQSVAILAVGYGGALRSAAAGTGALLAGLAVLLALALYYGGLFHLGRERHRDVLYLTSLALPLLLLGTGVLLGRPAYLWVALGLVCCGLGSRFERTTLGIHAVFYVTAAFVASGLLGQSRSAWLGIPGEGWPTPAADAFLTAVASIVCLVFKSRGDVAFWGRAAAVPKLVLFVLALFGSSSLFLWSLFAGTPGAGADHAIVASVRTVILSAAAFVLAWLGRRPAVREAGWLVYPILLLGALKLLFQDFPAGTPSTLFLALAVYGAALILIPRLRRTAEDGET